MQGRDVKNWLHCQVTEIYIFKFLFLLIALLVLLCSAHSAIKSQSKTSFDSEHGSVICLHQAIPLSCLSSSMKGSSGASRAQSVLGAG